MGTVTGAWGGSESSMAKFDGVAIRAWSAQFGASSCCVDPPPPPFRPLDEPGRAYLSDGQSYKDVHNLCAEANDIIDGRRPMSAPSRRRCPPEVVYNESTAFVHGMPGYTGFHPRVRQKIPKATSGLQLASQSARAYVRPAALPHFKRHAPAKDALSEFRNTCLANIGKGTPYLKDPGAPSFKTFYTNVKPGEYFVDVR